jgi:hypothetical protein
MKRLALAAVALLCGCSQTNGVYRLVEMPSAMSAGVSVLEVWDTPRGWETGGKIEQRQFFSHTSVLSQIAMPGAVAYAGHEIGDHDDDNSNEQNVTINGRPASAVSDKIP